MILALVWLTWQHRVVFVQRGRLFIEKKCTCRAMGLDLGLGCQRAFGVMYDYSTFLNMQITRSHFRPQIKWAVSLVIAYCYFNLPQACVWVCQGMEKAKSVGTISLTFTYLMIVETSFVLISCCGFVIWCSVTYINTSVSYIRWLSFSLITLAQW